MTPREKLDALMAQYADLKKRLVLIDRVKFERPDNIAFFHKEKLERLKRNQAITYKNVGEFLEKAFVAVDEYVQKLDGITYSAAPVSRSLSMYVNADYAHEYPASVPAGMQLRAADIAQEDTRVVTWVDGVRFSGAPFLYSETKGRNLDTSAVVYQVDAHSGSAYRMVDGTSFGADHPATVYIVGIRVNEPVGSGERVVVGGSFDMVVSMSSMDMYRYEVRPFYGSGSRVFAADLHAGAIPFFSIVDIFGNDVSVTGQLSGRSPLSVGAPISTQRAPEKLLAFTVNGVPTGLPTTDDFWITYLGGSFEEPMRIRFDLLKKADMTNAVYFPAMAPLAQKLMELTDEI